MPSGFLPATRIWTCIASTGRMPVGNYYLFSVTDSSSYYYVNQNSGVVEFALLAENMPV